MSRPNDTDPDRRPLLGAADTAPDPVDVQEDRSADMLLQGFDRTPVPPAPRPVSGASSDGRSFVQHYAVTRSAASMRRPSEASSVVLRRELGLIIAEKDADDSTQHEGVVASRNEPTCVVPGRMTRRRRAVWLVSGVVAVGVVLLFAAFMQTSETKPAPLASTPAHSASATPSASSILPTPAPSAQSSVSTTPSPSASSTQPTAPQAPPSVRALPAKGAAPKATPHHDDDDFERTLPR